MRELISVRPVVSAVVLLMLVACAGAQQATVIAPASMPSVAGNPSSLVVIPEVESVNGVAALSLIAQFDSAGRPAFFYQGSEVAPTIRVHPGDTIELTYVNHLPQYCSPGIESDTNLHFHGLTTAPVQPGDEVITTNATPGSTYTYTVRIDADQPPGLYWYHPHPHGLTNWEVGNGMAGAIVVEGIADEVPSTAGLRERVIVLRALPNDSSVAGSELLPAQAKMKRLAGMRSTADDACSNTPESDHTVTINGQTTAAIGIQPGERQLWRILNASGARTFDLAIPGAQLQLVGEDGVPLTDYAGGPQWQNVSDVVIPPAGRAEIVVTGPAQPEPIVSNCYDSGPAGDPDPQIVLGSTVNDNGTSATARVAKPMGLRMKQAYRVPPPAPVAERLLHFQEDLTGTHFFINGATYDPSAAPMYTVMAGTTEEWTLENDTDEIHDFHIHQVHFIVESINGVPNPLPHWVDTINIPAQQHGAQGYQVTPSSVKVLVDFRDPVIRGTFLFHCHLTEHEDGGMMAKIVAQ